MTRTGRALVTGGASGIGEAVARRLATDGLHVTVADVDEGRAKEVAQAVGGEAWAVDLAEGEALDDLELDVDVLVNNAGLQRVAPVEELAPADFRRIQRVMVEAPFLLVRAALPGMYERGFGRVVNVSSVHGLRASPHKVAYVAAKHALEGMSKVVALEGGPHGVTSSCVSPGFVRTPLVEHQVADQARLRGLEESQVLDEVLLAPAAVKRLVEPAEVADVVAYLASDRAAMVTGVSWTIDGGWTAR